MSETTAKDGSVVISIEGDNKEFEKALDETVSSVKSTLDGLDLKLGQTIDEKAAEAARKRSQQTISAVTGEAAATEAAVEEVGETGNAVLDFLGGVAQGVTETLIGTLLTVRTLGTAWDYATDARDLAAALEQINGVIDNVFGKRGAAVIEDWSNRTAQSFNMTEAAAKTYAATVGSAMGKAWKDAGYTEGQIAKMSRDLVERSVDFAAFYGIDMDSAFNKLVNSVTKGGKQLAAWGITFESGMSDMERYEQIMADTSDTVGAYAADAGTYDNAMDRLNASLESIQTTIGEYLLPMFTSLANIANNTLGFLLGTTNPLADGIGSIAAEANGNITAIEGTAAEAHSLVGILDSLANNTEKTAAQQAVWADTCDRLITLIPGLRDLIDEETQSLIGGQEALDDYVNSWKDAEKADVIQSAMADLEATTDGMEQNLEVLKVQRDAYAQALKTAQEGFDQTEYINAYAQQGTARVLGQDTSAWDARVAVLQGQKDAIDSLSKTLDDIDKEISDTQTALALKAQVMAVYEQELAALDQSAAAQANAETTGQAVAAGLKASLPEITSAVDSIIRQVSRLGYGGGGIGVSAVAITADGSYLGNHASGLDYVPKDNYLARLHTGESVLTAEEARVWRNMKYGDAPSMDYAAMGSAVGAGFGGMQVVWRGRVVADILSDMQGDSYRALERSRWKS